MKVYDVSIEIADVTEVHAETEAEAMQIAEEIFRENGYDTRIAHLEVESERELTSREAKELYTQAN